MVKVKLRLPVVDDHMSKNPFYVRYFSSTLEELTGSKLYPVHFKRGGYDTDPIENQVNHRIFLLESGVVVNYKYDPPSITTGSEEITLIATDDNRDGLVDLATKISEVIVVWKNSHVFERSHPSFITDIEVKD